MPKSPGDFANSPKDYSRLAGNYLIVLGVVSLLSLNLAGLLLIWIGPEVRERHEGFRKATVWVLGLGLIAGLGVLAWVTFNGTEGVTATILFSQIQAPPLWLVYTIGVPVLIVYGLPVYWLLQDKYGVELPSDLRHPTTR
jgi:hypothetical protein